MEYTRKDPGNWEVQTSSAYTITSNYQVDMTTLVGQSVIDINLDPLTCSPTTGTPSIGDIVTIIYDGNGGCTDVGTYSVLTYKIQDLSPSTGTTGTTTWALTLDRSVPDYTGKVLGAETGRVLIYPSGMTVIYDTITPAPYWETDAFNFETPCDVSQRENTPIWNMNIPWTQSPAGVFSSRYEDYTKYGSIGYIGTKEYLGYNQSSGQTDTSTVNYYNSYQEQVVVPPANQKAIAIIHYTNQDIDNVYGEEFLEGYYAEMKDPKNVDKTVDELKEIVRKNLAKNSSFYVENAAFGVKGIGYTKDAAGLGEGEPAKGKYKSSGYGDIKK